MRMCQNWIYFDDEIGVIYWTQCTHCAIRLLINGETAEDKCSSRVIHRAEQKELDACHCVSVPKM